MIDDYFKTYVNHFWEWDNDGEIATIVKGSTIAYRPLLVDIINTLSDQGLPRFEVLLAALIALNPRATDDIQLISSKIKSVIGNDDYYIEDAGHFLMKLAALPQDYKTGDNKLLVLRTVFEKTHLQLGLKDSEIIASGFENSFVSGPIISDPETIKKILKNAVKILALLNKQFEDSGMILKKWPIYRKFWKRLFYRKKKTLILILKI